MAAVFMGARRGRKRAKDSAEYSHDQFPPDEDVLMAGELQRQVMSPLGDTWQKRKVVLSYTKLMMGKPGDLNVVDHIPLDEILDVVPRRDDTEEQKTDGSKLNNTAIRTSLKRVSHINMEEDDKEGGMFVITTVAGGHNSGRSTVFLASGPEESERWIAAIQQGIKTCLKMKTRESESRFQRLQRRTRRIFSSLPLQIFFSLVILASFITAIISAESQPDPSSSTGMFLKGLEVTYLVIFAVELSMNLLSNWFWPFVKDGWNDLDFVVVVISVLSMIVPSLPALNSLRLIRIFKMIRLFRMLNSFRLLINALSHSVFPVLNAFCILLLVAAIFAIMATDFFSDLSEEYFGSFFKSLFTLFQMATGDSWASAVTRSLYTDDIKRNAWIGFFFVCYMLIVNVVLMNIVIAVLLDEFITTVEREKSERKAEEERKNFGIITLAQAEGPLDPLVRSLMNFSTIEELSANIFNLYQKMDIDESGAVDLEELNMGLKKLKLTPAVTLTEDEFSYLTDSRRLLNDDGELGADEFEEMIIREMSNYVHRKISASIRCEREEFNYEILFTMKSLLFHIEKINNPIFKQKKDMARKSKKEILRKLFTGPLLSSFTKWKEHVQVTVYGKEAKPIDPQWIEQQFHRIELLLNNTSSTTAQVEPARPVWAGSDMESISSKVQELQETVKTSLVKHDQDMQQLTEKVSCVLKLVERKTRKRSQDKYHRRAVASQDRRRQEGESPAVMSAISATRTGKRLVSSCDNFVVDPSSSSIPFCASSRSPRLEQEAAEQWRKGINPSVSERRREGEFEYVRISWFALPALFDSVTFSQPRRAFKSIRLLLCDKHHLFLRVREGEAREYLSVDMPDNRNMDALSYAWKLDEELDRILADNPELRIDPACYVDVSLREGNDFGRYFQATYSPGLIAGRFVDGTYVNGSLQVETGGGSRALPLDRSLHRAICQMQALKVTKEGS